MVLREVEGHRTNSWPSALLHCSSIHFCTNECVIPAVRHLGNWAYLTANEDDDDDGEN